MTGKLQTVHVRVNDAATGQPTPCRVRFTDATGEYYPPLGRLPEWAVGPSPDVGGSVLTGAKAYAYIDGACEIPLPPGQLRAEISKGPEYRPMDTTVELVAGKLSLRLAIERWTDLRAEGWYSGDTCVHFVPPHAALLEAQAEDVAVVNLLAKETVSRDRVGKRVLSLANLTAFSGQRFALEAPGHGVAVNTLNEHPELGRLALLHSHRAVYPLRFGAPVGPDDWTLADWCDQCHRKGGLVVWAHAAQPGEHAGLGEALANAVLGKVDAFQLEPVEDGPLFLLEPWSALLDAGFRLPLVGASVKETNREPLGRLRTYARLAPGSEFGYASWIEAVRAGRTFVTNGPLLELTVNGQEPSQTPLRVTDGPLRVRAEAAGVNPFATLDVVFNREVVAQTTPSDGPPYRAAIEFEHIPRQAGWLIARSHGRVEGHGMNDLAPFAATSPVYVEGPPAEPRPAAVERLLAELDRGLQWVQEKARCETPKQRDDLAGIFRTARNALLQKRPGPV